MRTCFLPLSVAGFMLLTSSVASLQAQQPSGAPVIVLDEATAPLAILPGDAVPAYVGPVEPIAPVPAPRRPLRNWLNRHGLGCYAELGTVGCSSLRRELQFAFGSCRTFFPEPCRPLPPRRLGGFHR